LRKWLMESRRSNKVGGTGARRVVLRKADANCMDLPVGTKSERDEEKEKDRMGQ